MSAVTINSQNPIHGAQLHNIEFEPRDLDQPHEEPFYPLDQQFYEPCDEEPVNFQIEASLNTNS